MTLIKSTVTACTAALTLASGSLLAPDAEAATISFQAEPISPALPEFVYTGVGPTPFDEGAGSIGGNGVDVAGGLAFEVPFIIPGISDSAFNFGEGTTSIADATLLLDGGVLGGPPAGSPLVSQAIGSTGFSIFDSSGLLLLDGTLDDYAVSGLPGTGVASVLGTATYTDGLLFDFLDNAGGQPVDGEFSFALFDVSPTFSVTSGALDNFDANSAGGFVINANFIPEPDVLSLMALGVVLRRRR